jgi:hypothetical protein
MSSRSPLHKLFFQEPAGRFGLGHVLANALPCGELERLERDDVGCWQCDLANQDALSWSKKVYEIFGLPHGEPINRGNVVKQYRDHSRGVLERLRAYAINKRCGFILDAEISSPSGDSHWIRILATPALERGRVIGLHGLKRMLS